RIFLPYRHHVLYYFYSRLRRALTSTLFPYTTLFRSSVASYRGLLLVGFFLQFPFHDHTQLFTVCGDEFLLYLTAADRYGNVIGIDRKSTRLNSSHVSISYAVFCLKKKNNHNIHA